MLRVSPSYQATIEFAPSAAPALGEVKPAFTGRFASGAAFSGSVRLLPSDTVDARGNEASPGATGKLSTGVALTGKMALSGRLFLATRELGPTFLGTVTIQAAMLGRVDVRSAASGKSGSSPAEL